jgi:hypothetical protein
MDKKTIESAFSENRMEQYFKRYTDLEKAIMHYQCNIELSEAFYPCIHVFEVLLRNNINRELTKLFGREDWYDQFTSVPGLTDLYKYITQADKQIAGRKELSCSSKIVAELTLGFWVSLFNVEYERILWKDLRKVFPNMPKKDRQRKKIAPPLNRFRTIRNRIFHHEPISWNIGRIKQIHTEVLTVLRWMNIDIAAWFATFDRFDIVRKNAEKLLYDIS